MKNVSKDEIKQAFKEVGLERVDHGMISKCVATANNLHISAETMATVWESFSLNKKIEQLTDHSWQSFRVDLVKEADRNPNRHSTATTTPMEIDGDNKIKVKQEGAVSARKGMGKRQVGAPDEVGSLPLVTPPAKRPATGEKGTPSAVDTVLSNAETPLKIKGMSTYTPPKYEERSGAGKVILTFNPSDIKPTTTAETTATDHAKCGIAYNHFETNVSKPYRHLFTTMEDRAKALDQHLVRLEDIMMDHYKIKGKDVDHTMTSDNNNNEGADEEIAPLEAVGCPRQEKVCCIGRICNVAHEGRINATSVVIEGSKHFGGARIEVDLSHLQEGEKASNFSLFPGQIVAIEGMNSTGRKLTAHRICEGAAHGGNKSTAKQLLQYHHDEQYQNGKPLKIMSVAGPYTTSDNLGYEPFDDFMGVVLKEQPDVVIMAGPFVDLRHKGIQSGEVLLQFQDDEEANSLPYETFFANRIAALLEEYFSEDGAPESKTQFVLVPSLDDATAEWVYPQAPFQENVFGQRGKILKVSGDNSIAVGTLGLDPIEPREKETNPNFRRVHCVSNPCTLQINEVIIGVTGTDAIFHMSADETNANLVPGSRLARISQHMLQQRSYYPLFPASPGTNLDLKRMGQWNMPCKPDVLIVPSKLTSFARPVLGDTVVINPGQLSKNTTGGTFGIMEIHPMKREELENAGGDDVELDHNIAERMLLEIRKI